MEAAFKYIISFVLLPLIACTVKDKRVNLGTVNFTDTLHKTYISILENGDTSRTHFTYYFKPTDLAVDTSSFFYKACNHPCEDEKIYKIYFPRRQVILFCDSMLNTFPPNIDNEWHENFNARNTYKNIRYKAATNNIDKGDTTGELVILLTRFSPFVVNPVTQEKLKYIIIEIQDESTGGEYKNYAIKTILGDTIFLDGIPLRLAPIKEIQ